MEFVKRFFYKIRKLDDHRILNFFFKNFDQNSGGQPYFLKYFPFNCLHREYVWLWKWYGGSRAHFSKGFKGRWVNLGYFTTPRVPVEVKSARVTTSMPWLHNLHSILHTYYIMEFKILPNGATTSFLVTIKRPFFRSWRSARVTTAMVMPELRRVELRRGQHNGALNARLLKS